MSAVGDAWIKRVLDIEVSVVPKGAVNYAKSRLAWTAAKDRVGSELKSLEQIILSRYSQSPALPEIAQKIRKFDDVLALFAEDLGDVLDKAYSAADPAKRQTHHREAAAVIAKFLARANDDPFMTKLEANPYMPFTGRKVLLQTLSALSRQIA
jgi:hypothetical protein